MKTTTTIAILIVASLSFASQANADTILTGWYEFPNVLNKTAPDVAVTGVTGGITGGATGGRSGWTSTDGTFGPTESTGAGDSGGVSGTPNGAFTIRTLNAGEQNVDVTINNGSGSAITLGRFAFDYRAITGGAGFSAIDQLTLAYLSGDLAGVANNTVIGTVNNANMTPLPASPFVADFFDASFSLAGLADVVLDSGESAVFRIIGADNIVQIGEGTGVALGLDNFAITEGTTIPAPAALPLGLLAMGLAAAARRFR